MSPSVISTAARCDCRILGRLNLWTLESLDCKRHVYIGLGCGVYKADAPVRVGPLGRSSVSVMRHDDEIAA